MPSMKDVEERLDRIAKLKARLEAEEDMVRYLELVQQLEGEGKELQSALEAMQASVKVTPAKKNAGRIEAVLTPDQRARVLHETGVNMSSVFVDDPEGTLNAAMPAMKPAAIEAEALNQAKQKKAAEKARKDARDALEQYFRELEANEKLNPEDVQRLKAEMLAKLG